MESYTFSTVDGRLATESVRSGEVEKYPVSRVAGHKKCQEWRDGKLHSF